MAKGISSIISTVLLLMIVIAFTAAFFIFSSRMFSTTQNQASESINRTAGSMQLCLKFESASANNIYVRNCGPSQIQNNTISVYVDGSSVLYSIPNSIDPDEVGTITIIQTLAAGNHEVKVSGAGYDIIENVWISGGSVTTTLSSTTTIIGTTTTTTRSATTIPGTTTSIATTTTVSIIFQKRYILVYSFDLTKQNQSDYLRNIIGRASAAGYNGIVIGDGTFTSSNYSQSYINNITSLVNYGRQLGVDLIPYSFHQGVPLSDSVAISGTTQGRNELAEALPVVDTKFIVENGTPLINIIPNSDFELWNVNQPIPINVDMQGVVSFHDDQIKHSGNSSLRIQDTYMNLPWFHGRVISPIISVEPNRIYQLSLWIRTENFTRASSAQFLVYGYDENETNSSTLYNAPIGCAINQEWTEYKINFTNKNRTKVRVYFGIWVNTTGKVWFDDANLSEIGFDGVAQRDAVATAVSDPTVFYPSPGFENWSNITGSPIGFTMDSSTVFRDTVVKHSGNNSIRIQDTFNNLPYYHARIISNPFDVQPYRTYTFSFWLKTENVSSPGEIATMVFGYNYTNGTISRHIFGRSYAPKLGSPVASTQDWTQYNITFNSLDNSRVRIYFGLWSNISGSLWFDDVSNLTELGLYNTVQRASMPVTVKSHDGSIVYQSGKDFIVKDRKLSIPNGSAITVGSSLKVSWFQFANMIDGSAPASACQESFYTYLKRDVQRLNNLFLNPPAFFVAYDEWRVGNWDPACKDLNGGQEMNEGKYMAYAMNRTESLIREIRPDADIILWSDMFDPYHNAVPVYVSVKGSVEGSWNGVSPNITIANWNYQTIIDNRTNQSKFNSSVKFFNNRTNHQIFGGYYEGQGGLFTRDVGFLNTLALLGNSTNGIPYFDGYLYCTWFRGQDGFMGEFKDIEAVADLMRARGRWP